LITFLTVEETAALIDAVDVSTWTGRRDRTMLMPAAQTVNGRPGRYRPPDSLLAFLDAL
jgi:hypothetical protein